MSGKNTIFEDKKIKKVISTKAENYNYDRWHWCWQNIGFKKEPYGTNKSIKYFIGYNDDDVIRLLYKTSLNVKCLLIISY